MPKSSRCPVHRLFCFLMVLMGSVAAGEVLHAFAQRFDILTHAFESVATDERCRRDEEKGYDEDFLDHLMTPFRT
jgi:hypothetical protein